MTNPRPKFEVDAAGLAKILERRGKVFAIYELIQNAWDTNAKNVKVELWGTQGVPTAQLIVTDDDPDGFDDLSHAFTLYAESRKRRDPQKRGWINLGEKLVLALCTKAVLETTKGTIEFSRDSRHEYPRRKIERGTIFSAEIKMTRAEIAECCQLITMLIPPPGVETSFNGVVLPERKPLTTFEVVLPTHVADEEGIMRRRQRQATVHVYEPGADETGALYEMGIPIVETGDTWHIDVQQKVPLNTDRDNVPPSYLRTLRAHVANELRAHLSPEIAAQGWMSNALEDDAIVGSTVNAVLDERFGKKRFTFDPSDLEANNRLVSEGYTPIHAGSLSGRTWAKVKAFDASTPAGKLRPTAHEKFSPNGRPLHEIPHEKQTKHERAFVRLAKAGALEVMKIPVDVVLVSDPAIVHGACYGDRRMIVNKFRLGSAFFNPEGSHYSTMKKKTASWVDLIVHELAHEYESNHLSAKYHEACTRLAGGFFAWAMNDYDNVNNILLRD